MENLNNVPSTGTFGNSVQKINSNFDLIVNAINSLEYQTTRSKGILNYGQNPATVFPNAVAGDWCMILSQGNVFPATIKTYNGSTWSGSGTWNPDGVDLTGYAKTTDMTTAIANSLAQATARMGYGECTVNGTSLSVSIPNFILPTNGGQVHIKMSAVGTGASTLNINSTGAKTLWYNGAAVSSTNTWEAGEIISVFYDGTKYMSSNSQGGGGDAKKIKYDNSKSGLATKNVQGALDDIVSESNDNQIISESVINITADFTLKNHYYINTAGVWKYSSNHHSSYYKAVSVGETYHIKASAEHVCYYAFLTEVNASSNANAAFVDGYSLITIGINEERIFKIPSGTNYLYVTYKISNVVYAPEYIKAVETIKEHVLAMGDVNETIKEVSQVPLYITLPTYRAGSINPATGKWTSNTTAKRHYLIAASKYERFKLVSNNTVSCYYAWLKNGTVTASQYPNYSDYVPKALQSIPVGQTGYTSDKPSDANYLYVGYLLDGVDYTPSAVYGMVSSVELIEEHDERLSALEPKTYTYPYIGERIRFDVPTFKYEQFTACTGKNSQGCAYSNGYIFMWQNNSMKNLFVYNMEKMEASGNDGLIYTWTNPLTFSSHYHGNQCTFSNVKYDTNDPFPLLYTSVFESSSGSGRSSQLVYRITAEYDDTTQEYTSFSLTPIQVILFPTITSDNLLCNVNMAIDTSRNKMVCYSGGLSLSSAYNIMITEFELPSISSGTTVDFNGYEVKQVTLEDSNIVTHYKLDYKALNCQGGVVRNNKLFMVRGLAKEVSDAIFVVDLIKKCLASYIDLYNAGFEREPEGLFFYNGDLIMSTRTGSLNGYFYKFSFG